MNETVFNFEKLEVWRNAMDLAKETYSLIRLFPAYEKYSLADQLRRSSTSVALNIAEGHGRHHNKDFKRFLFNARGSLFETVTCLKLAVSLQYIDPSVANDILNKCKYILRQLNGLICYLGKEYTKDKRQKTKDTK